MLKFISQHMSTIDGIAIYPIISLSIFVAFFTALIVWAVRSDKKKIQEIAEIPLD